MSVILSVNRITLAGRLTCDPQSGVPEELS